MMQNFDLLVIGAGSGGVRCARIAAQHGARVAVVERRFWGGTCVNLGCVPKKLMVYAAQSGEAIEDAAAYGWAVKKPAHDWSRFIEAKDREVARLSGLYADALEKAGVTMLRGEARFLDACHVEVGPSPLAPDAERRLVCAEKIVIATGSEPRRPDIPGAEMGITSDEIFHLPARPARIAIIGGGYIGVEFAGILAGLGSKVELIYRQDFPLRGFDGEMRVHLADRLGAYGINAHPSRSPERIEKAGGNYRLFLDDGAVLETDCVFFATGRRPAVSGLGLEQAGVVLEDGHIVVDDALATNVPGLYAIGDAIDRYNLTPTAIAQGHGLAERLFGDAMRDWSFETTPKAVFFSQPLACVGLTEEDAAEHHALDIYTTAFTAMKQILPARLGKTFMKLVVDARTEIVLGAHMMGPYAPEMIQCLAVAVTAKLTKRDFDRTIALHPTSAEEFVTMRMPVRHVSARGVAGG